MDLLQGGQGVFNIVPLASVIHDLRADIVALSGDAVPEAPSAAAAATA